MNKTFFRKIFSLLKDFKFQQDFKKISKKLLFQINLCYILNCMKKIISRPFLLEPAFKYYEWGSETAIQEITGRKELEGKTAAEMWMGDHPSGANFLVDGTEKIPFHDLVKEKPDKILGKNVSKKYRKSLPFLFKVLAASKPLSIQSHPSRKQAEEGFERENILEIPMDDFTRGYKDSNHKPEIILALTSFKMMKGFRSYSSIRDNLKKYCPATSQWIIKEMGDVKDLTESKKLKKFFKTIMSCSCSDTGRMIDEALKNSQKEEFKDKLESDFIRKFSEYYPDDAGILSPIYLNCSVLEKGEAVYIPAGELHAYVEGTGIELMANSDNVFRGGLTPKHVDREELYKILKYRTTEIRKTDKKVNGCEKIFTTESEEFLLSEIIVDKENNYVSDEDRNIDILICYEGSAEVECESSKSGITVMKGDSFVLPSAARKYTITGEGTFYKATVPYEETDN